MERKVNEENLKKVKQYHLWIPLEIYNKLHSIQEEKGIPEYNMNDQIVKILKKHFNQK